MVVSLKDLLVMAYNVGREQERSGDMTIEEGRLAVTSALPRLYDHDSENADLRNTIAALMTMTRAPRGEADMLLLKRATEQCAGVALDPEPLLCAGARVTRGE